MKFSLLLTTYFTLSNGVSSATSRKDEQGGFSCTLCPTGVDPVPGDSVVDVVVDLNVTNRTGIDLNITCDDAIVVADQISNFEIAGPLAQFSEASCRALQVVGVARCGCPRPPGADEDRDIDGEEEFHCSLCFDGSTPTNLEGKVTVAGVEISCQAASFVAPSLGRAACTAARSFATVACGCSSPIPDAPTCSLCGDGKSLPSPERLAIAEESCDALQTEAGGYLSDCSKWQSTAGVYCGCYGESGKDLSPELEENACRICPDGLLPNPLRIPEGLGDLKSCGRIEIDANVLRRGTCENVQETYREECCKPEFGSADRLSTSGSDSRLSKKTVFPFSILAIFASIGFF